MDPFKLKNRVVRQMLKDRPSVAEGMDAVLAIVREAPHGKAWEACTPPKGGWSMLERKWAAWFDALLRQSPPPRRTEMLWFEYPSELNPALTSVSGYAELDRTEELFGLENGRHWPEDSDGNTLPEGLLELPELDAFTAAAGWAIDLESEATNKLLPAYYAISTGLTLLLILNALPRTKLLASVEPAEVAVVTGWVEGDLDAVGMLTADGWRALKRNQARSHDSVRADPEQLDPSSYAFHLPKYLQTGGDPSWADPKTGETLLMREQYAGLKTVRVLLKAGADVKRTDRSGRGVLHYFAAAELHILHHLLDAGADPTLVDKSGISVFDLTCDDGRCTVAHLRLLWEHGARPGKSREGTPLHRISDSGLYKRTRVRHIREMLAWSLKCGMDLEAKDRNGASPLWRALEHHAKELESVRRRPPSSSDRERGSGYRHDEVAAILLELGADPNARLKQPESKLIPPNATPLMVRRYDNEKLAAALLKHGADPMLTCAKGKTALHYAREAAKKPERPGHAGAAKVVRLLENAMAKAGAKSSKRATPRATSLPRSPTRRKGRA